MYFSFLPSIVCGLIQAISLIKICYEIVYIATIKGINIQDKINKLLGDKVSERPKDFSASTKPRYAKLCLLKN